MLTVTRSSKLPTQDQVLVPETLLKKRKSQEQARAARLEAAQKRKQVSLFVPNSSSGARVGWVMIAISATRLRSMLSLTVNHLSGLTSNTSLH